MNAEDIASEIVNLTISLEDKEELKTAWRIIYTALSYLSAKDSMFSSESQVLEMITEAKEKRVEKYV